MGGKKEIKAAKTLLLKYYFIFLLLKYYFISISIVQEVFCLGSSQDTAARHPDLTHERWIFSWTKQQSIVSPEGEQSFAIDFSKERTEPAKHFQTPPTNNSTAPWGCQGFNRQDLLTLTTFEMTLKLSYMKKIQSYVAVTHPQQFLITNIREFCLSEENYEEGLGTPMKSVSGELGGQQK